MVNWRIAPPAVISIFFLAVSAILPDDSILLKQIAQCERHALKLGTEIGDTFNEPIGPEGWGERVHQEFIATNLGFAPYLSKGPQKDFQSKANWTGRSIDESPYKVLNHKWIYMFGDSTTRQIWASFAQPFQGNNFERNAKEWTRQYVSYQSFCCCAAFGLRKLLYGDTVFHALYSLIAF
jgi:hypothetical protein